MQFLHFSEKKKTLSYVAKVLHDAHFSLFNMQIGGVNTYEYVKRNVHYAMGEFCVYARCKNCDAPQLNYSYGQKIIKNQRNTERASSCIITFGLHCILSKT